MGIRSDVVKSTGPKVLSKIKIGKLLNDIHIIHHIFTVIVDKSENMVPWK